VFDNLTKGIYGEPYQPKSRGVGFGINLDYRIVPWRFFSVGRVVALPHLESCITV
jgi:hypothetical protein